MQVFYQAQYPTNGIFGLGTEAVSNSSDSFLARAVAQGQISSYEYSFNMAPNDTISSQLILGPYTGSYTNATNWFNMAVGSDGWTGNVTACEQGDTSLMPGNYSRYNATFDTGYPYIGLPDQVFDNLADLLEKQDENIDCDHGFCSARKNCTDMKPLKDLVFTMGGSDFTIPMNSTFFQSYKTNGNDASRQRTDKPICLILIEKLQQVSHTEKS